MHQYVLDKPDNLVDFLEETVKAYPDNKAIGTKNAAGDYVWITYGDFGRRVDNVRAGLARLGVTRGDAVGIIANNRTEWVICAYAAFSLGVRWVPMYEAELTSVWKYIVADSGIKVLFCSKPEILEKVKDFPKDIKTLEKMILVEGSGPDSMEELELIGRSKPVASIRPRFDEVACLIYTSGTTGDPKGVLLTHGNLTSNTLAGLKIYPEFNREDTLLSILPWAHSYALTAELNAAIKLGGKIAIMESIGTLAQDMLNVKPDFLVVVPRVFNKIYDGLFAKMNAEKGLTKTLFFLAVKSAQKKRALAEQGKSDMLLNLKCAVLDKLVFSKIRERFGGRLRGAMTASAAMNPDIAKFFFDIGIPVYDCYGMTETSPAIAMNCPSAYRLGSVGRAIDKVKIVIDKSVVEEGATDGEIVCYGPNVMQGYHNKPDATAAVMTEDGGIRTGDRGRIDDDGYLFITGRIKEQYKLENGKFVFPSSMEEDIRLIPFIENAMVYGENRPYNICLIIPDFQVLGSYAKQHGLPQERDRLIQSKDVENLIMNAITNQLKGKYGGYEIPKKIVLLKENFSVDDGTLTQTLKVKRRVVLKKHQDLIEAAYQAK